MSLRSIVSTKACFLSRPSKSEPFFGAVIRCQTVYNRTAQSRKGECLLRNQTLLCKFVATIYDKGVQTAARFVQLIRLEDRTPNLPRRRQCLLPPRQILKTFFLDFVWFAKARVIFFIVAGRFDRIQ